VHAKSDQRKIQDCTLVDWNGLSVVQVIILYMNQAIWTPLKTSSITVRRKIVLFIHDVTSTYGVAIALAILERRTDPFEHVYFCLKTGPTCRDLHS
jgi:hypothetical protein